MATGHVDVSRLSRGNTIGFSAGSLQDFYVMALAAVALGFLIAIFILRGFLNRRRSVASPPSVPGLPLIGNLHQLKEKRPHQTFVKWAESFGPIYSIKTGACTVVVLNSTELAKEAMVTKFSSISTRKLPNALKILTANKSMVAMSDYGEFHKMVKRYILTSVLGASAQKRSRRHREVLVDNVLDQLNACVKKNPFEAVNLREMFKNELFGLALKQAVGADIESIFVEELKAKLTKKQVFDILVADPLMGAIDVDWRDFFPYFKWVPNKSVERRIHGIAVRKFEVTKALIHRQKGRINSGERIDCYLDFLLSEGKTLTDEQVIMLVWEAIIEASDTTMLTTEWAMFELAKNQKHQDHLYQEIQMVCGSAKMIEDNLANLPYLNAVFQETLRKHCPVPIIPLRHVHEDTQLGGYCIPRGTEIAVNIYGCNMNKEEWDHPEEWRPERFLEKPNDVMDLHKTMSFGAGKRWCAGALQAMLISCSAIGRFVQEFEWRLAAGEEENEDTVQLTTHKLHPMRTIIRKRKYSPQAM